MEDTRNPGCRKCVYFHGRTGMDDEYYCKPPGYKDSYDPIDGFIPVRFNCRTHNDTGNCPDFTPKAEVEEHYCCSCSKHLVLDASDICDCCYAKADSKPIKRCQ